MSGSSAALKLVPPSLRDSEFAGGEGFELYRGDCLEVLSAFGPQSFDLIFADPPYFLSNGGFTGARLPL